MVETDANSVIRDLYARLGWQAADGGWRGAAPDTLPAHVRVAVDG